METKTKGHGRLPMDKSLRRQLRQMYPVLWELVSKKSGEIRWNKVQVSSARIVTKATPIPGLLGCANLQVSCRYGNKHYAYGSIISYNPENFQMVSTVAIRYLELLATAVIELNFEGTINGIPQWYPYEYKFLRDCGVSPADLWMYQLENSL